MGAVFPVIRVRHGATGVFVIAGLALAQPCFAQMGSPDVARIIDVASGPSALPGKRAGETAVLDVPAPSQRGPHHAHHRHSYRLGWQLQRPVLAGVRLVTPLAPPVQTPDVPVIAPAYPLDSVLASLTTPPPPVVCQHRPRDPGLPHPHLAGEVPLVCHYDID